MPPRLASRPLLPALLALLLAGCGGHEPHPATAAHPGLISPVLDHRPPPAARMQAVPGVQGVIGASRAQLVAQFGPPRLDTREGDALKLQFAGSACVLDVYLYPMPPAQEPVATFIAARRAGDAREVSRADCVTLLRRR